MSDLIWNIGVAGKASVGNIADRRNNSRHGIALSWYAAKQTYCAGVATATVPATSLKNGARCMARRSKYGSWRNIWPDINGCRG